ncbi:MAG: hypothetical protein AAF488_18695 [Planctomycetota bacterium]
MSLRDSGGDSKVAGVEASHRHARQSDRLDNKRLLRLRFAVTFIAIALSAALPDATLHL